MNIRIKRLTILIFSITILSGCDNSPNKYSNDIISSAHPLASIAGKNIYEIGGNAFDAAVAAAFSLAVVEPSMSGIGGRMQSIYQTQDGIISGIDASTEVPLNYKPLKDKFSYGYQTIGIPGVVAGLVKLQKENGNLSLKEVLAPAIKYAKEGFLILPGEAIRQKMAFEKINEFEGTSYHFLKSEGMSYIAGDLVIQKDLSLVLEKIANEGHKGFYEGKIAEKIVSDIQKHGGILTLEDLKNYKALTSKVVQGKYRNHTINSLYLPSYGAITIQILQILDNLPPAKSEEEWAINMGKATEIAYGSRKYQTNKDSLRIILSYDRAKILANNILKKDVTFNFDNDNLPESWVAKIGHTTHLTTADRNGNIVSLTQTVGPNMGSKVATKGLGFIYAVTLGGYLGDYKPGDRANSHISPTLISKNNTPVLALGAAGGSRIITAVTQVASRYIDQNNTLEKSLMLPRVYPFEDSLWIEDHSGVKELNAELNIITNPYKMIDEIARFGRVHAVAIDSINKKWIGAADPDWEGTTEINEK
ncbi:MAG: hypothetical protein CMC04_04855 [Flavobacteriaceae bacterium]|nr:hypothetical protein [Flavobacteriaceae bacterium]